MVSYNPTTEIKLYQDAVAEIRIHAPSVWPNRGQRHAKFDAQLRALGWPVHGFDLGGDYAWLVYTTAERAVHVRAEIDKLIAEVL